jgi:predicted small secreted protein
VCSFVVTTIVKDSIMLKKLMLLLVALTIGSPVLLTGCNTMQGAGRDISSAGNKIQDEAAEHKHY